MNRGFICALCLSVAFALLAGCGGSQPPIGAPGAMPQRRSIAQHGMHGKSWMLPEAKRRDLLYLSRGPLVYVYSYPHGGLVGTLYFGTTDTYGECADKAGHVFITAGNGAYEYRHGDTAPIASFYNPAGRSQGCSVNPVTGSLAISGGSPNGPILSTYAFKPNRGWRFAKLYFDSTIQYGSFCGYDDVGNLYIDGIGTDSDNFVFAVLPKGAKALTNITLNQNIKTGGQVQWDGRHVAIGDAGVSPSVVYQFTIAGSSGTEVSSTTLDGSKEVLQFWLQGQKLVGPDGGNGNVGFWKYPNGGRETKEIELAYPYGAAVSVAPHN